MVTGLYDTQYIVNNTRKASITQWGATHTHTHTVYSATRVMTHIKPSANDTIANVYFIIERKQQQK